MKSSKVDLKNWIKNKTDKPLNEGKRNTKQTKIRSDNGVINRYRGN